MKRKIIWMIVSLLIVLTFLLVGFGCAAPAGGPTATVTKTTTATVTTTATATATTTATAAATPVAKVITWKYHTHEAKDARTLAKTKYLANAINTYTDGHIKLEIYFTNEIVPPTELLGAVSKGIVEMIECYPGYWVGQLPGLADVEGGLPYSWRTNLEALENFQDYGLQDLASKEYAKLGIHYGTVLFINPVFLWSKKPLNTLNDLKGLKARSTGNMAKMLEALGVSTVFVPGPEIYSGLMLGTFEAATWGSWVPDLGMKFHEVTDYVVVDPPIGRVWQHTLFNENSWNKLPQRDQFLVTKAIRDYSVWCEVIFNSTEGGARNEILAKKKTLTEIRWTDPAILAKMSEVAQTLRAGAAKLSPVGAEAVKLLESYLRGRGYIQ